MSEEWRTIAGWEGYYEVSDLGRVRSLDRIVTQRANGGKMMQRFSPGRIMAAGKDNKGYPVVGFCRDGVATRRLVHQLVLEAFVAPRPAGAIGDHMNGVRDDNLPANLRWVTYRANARNRHKPRRDNPHVGVDYRAGRSKPWRAKSTDRTGRSRHLGFFTSPEEATAAYLQFCHANFYE